MLVQHGQAPRCFEVPMRLLPALLTAATLCAAPALSQGLEAMTEAERAAFRAEVKAYLLDNPEVLVEAMNVLQDRQDMAEAARDAEMLQTHAEAIFEDPASFVGGNPDGDITVVEFLDYRCSYCRKANAEVAELVASDGNIRFVVKEFPILGADSVASSRFAIAVLQLHGALMTLRGSPDAETLARMAGELGLDPQPILDHMASDEVTAVIEANHALGDALAISGTPTFVIDGTMLRGYVPLDGMRQIVADERAS
jgi:protein-disulfide isomerase